MEIAYRLWKAAQKPTLSAHFKEFESFLYVETFMSSYSAVRKKWDISDILMKFQWNLLKKLRFFFNKKQNFLRISSSFVKRLIEEKTFSSFNASSWQQFFDHARSCCHCFFDIDKRSIFYNFR